MADEEQLPARKRRKACRPATSGEIETYLQPRIEGIPRDAPKKRLLHQGAGALTDAELVAILSDGEHSIFGASDKEILVRFGGIQGLGTLDLEIARAQGLSERQAVLLLTAIELGRRLNQKPGCVLRIAEPAEVAGYLVGHFGATTDQQVVGVMFADSSGRNLGLVECFRGTHFRLCVDTRTILREALCRNATALLVFWFRPTLKPEGNYQDFEFRKKLSAACNALGFELLDFLVLSCDSWLSLRRLKPW